jgi:alkaline phosphatase D
MDVEGPMDSIHRRDFLRVMVVTAAASGASMLFGCSSDEADVRVTFPQGVASGDPREDSVVLWTRVETESKGSETVNYELALDQDFRQLVASGQVLTGADSDHTVHLKVTGLAPYTRYYYRFMAHGVLSETGRTLTAPTADADVPVRLAVAYGQSYVGRYFTAWRVLVEQEKDVDFVLFLGDYVYEADVIVGAQDPTPDRHVKFPDGLALGDSPEDGVVAWTLNDYRLLYRTWRTDEDLKRAHRLYPFVTVWDDHEFSDDCWQDHANDFNGARGDEQETARREAATRAWYEYIPVDVDYNPDAGFPNDIRLYRSFGFGRHVDLFVTDQRYYRDDHVIPEGPIDLEVGKVQKNSILGSRILVIKDMFDQREEAASPTMLGDNQRGWFVARVKESTATWKLIGNPTFMAQMLLDLTDIDTLLPFLRKPFYFKLDQWDGYRSERTRILSDLAGVSDMVVLTADLHASCASDIHVDFDNPDSLAMAVEYMGPSISSISLKEQLALAVGSDPLLNLLGLGALVDQADAIFRNGNPHFRYVQTQAYGYMIVDVDRDREVRVDMVHVPDVLSPEAVDPVERVRFRTVAGTNRVELL